MRYNKKAMIISTILLASMLCMVCSPAGVDGTTLESDIGLSSIYNPYQDSLIGHFFENIEEIVGNTQKANITGTNVYYYSNSISSEDLGVGNRTRNLDINEQGSQSVNTAALALFFSNWYNNVVDLESNITYWANNLSSFTWGSLSSGWTEEAWKQDAAIAFYAIVVNYNPGFNDSTNFTQFVNTLETRVDNFIPLAFSAPARFVASSWANATPEEIMLVLNSYVEPVNTLWTMVNMYMVDNGLTDITNVAFNSAISWIHALIEPAKNELTGGASSLSVNYDIVVDLSFDSSIEDKSVAMLWDHDDTVNNYVQDPTLRNLRNIFSGDEILYLVQFSRINTTVSGNIASLIEWQYDNGSTPVAFMNALEKIIRRPYAAHLISEASGAPVQALRAMLYGNVSLSGSRTFHDSTFNMGQFKVNEFELNLFNDDPTLIDLWYGEHKMVGLFAYDDLNENGIQDIEIKGTFPFLYPASNESRYRYKINKLDDIIYTAPSVVNNELIFGINFTGLEGALVPFDINDDLVSLNDTIDGAIPENVSSIGFDFKFGVDRAENKGSMKVDYKFANFTNSPDGSADPALNNLSLSMVTALGTVRLRAGERTVDDARLIDQGREDIDLNTNTTREVGAIWFASGTSLGSRIFEMDLASIPYQLGGQDYEAKGQLIPVMVGGIAYGRETIQDNVTVQSGLVVNVALMLYSVNFPTWGGQAIIHDPVFSTFIPSGGLGPLAIAAIVAGVGVVGIIIIVSIVKLKRRSSSYTRHLARVSEVKERASVKEISLLHSFFSRIPPRIPGDKKMMVNPYIEGIFQFFSALIKIVVRSKKKDDLQWNESENTAFRPISRDFMDYMHRLLDDPRIIDCTKYEIPEFTQKGYYYELFSTVGEKFYMVDIYFCREPLEVHRLTIFSREPITKNRLIELQEPLNMIAFAFDTPGIEIMHLLADYLPIDLSYSRHFNEGSILSFLRDLQDDPDISRDDLAEIRQDLKIMDQKQTLRLIDQYRRSIERESNKHGVNPQG